MLFSKNHAIHQLNAYLDYCQYQKNYTPSTLKTKRNTILLFIEFSGTRNFEKVTARDVQSWHEQMLRDGKAGKTVNSYKDHVIGLIKYLRFIKKRKVKLDREEIISAEEAEKEPVWFEPEEIEIIKKECRTPMERLIISLLFESMIRHNELRNLRFQEIKDNSIFVKQGKGRKDRRTFILDGTIELLKDYMQARNVQEGYVFPSPTAYGRPISPYELRRVVNGPIRRAGFAIGSSHAMRHSGATELVNGSNGDLPLAQEILGHADISITRRYFHVTKAQLQHRYFKAMIKKT